MKIAIMQPYFLPYQGYWQLFAEADIFVIFDLVAYQKRSWMCRNRVLSQDITKEDVYINIPVKKSESGLIKDTRVVTTDDWAKSLKGSLGAYKRMRAPGYDNVTKIIDDLGALGDLSLSNFAKAQFELILPELGLSTEILIASELGMSLPKNLDAGQWALQISKQLGATEYINPPSGYKIFDPIDFDEENIKLRFLEPHLLPYKQGRRESFIKGLSIIDLLMCSDPSAAIDIVKNDYSLKDWYTLARDAQN